MLDMLNTLILVDTYVMKLRYVVIYKFNLSRVHCKKTVKSRDSNGWIGCHGTSCKGLWIGFEQRECRGRNGVCGR